MTRPRGRRTTRRVGTRRQVADVVLDAPDVSLLDIVDHVLDQGVVLSGEVVLGLADVDLIYLRVQAILTSADRLLGAPHRRSPRQRSEG